MRSILILFTHILCLYPTIAQTDPSKPFVLGRIEEIQSAALTEKRTLNIYLPEGYKTNDTTHYPVIYLLDGGADEDFIHVVGLVQFNSFEWVDRVPKSIVVGIANVDRRRDLTFPTHVEKDKIAYPTAGHSDRFIDFIEKELQPYIDRQYRTTGSRTLIGESLGGLLATEILLQKPGLFNQYIIISPSLWWDRGSLLNFNLDHWPNRISSTLNIYIGVGKEGLTPGEPPRVMEVDANILADKLTMAKAKNVGVYLDYIPEENHATIAHQALLNAFKIIHKASLIK